MTAVPAVDVATAVANAAGSAAPIGIFDSGVGGLSILRHIRAQLPQEHLLYVADSAFAPYGDKPEQVVAARSLIIADFLVARGAKALVVACNTATVAAIKALRLHYPDMPIVGVEPGLKPAAAASHSGKVGVLATDVTLHGAKFLALREQVSAASSVEFLLQPCVGLVDQIELGDLGASEISAMLKRYITPLLAQGADTIVLGCTHYPLVRATIEKVIAAATDAPVTLVDTGDAVARQLARLLTQGGLLRGETGAGAGAGAGAYADVSAGENVGKASLEAFTSASVTALSKAFSNLVGLTPPVSQVRFPEPALTGFPAPV
ncbi:MAG: glutamate racemase [Pseudomonadota bacterium]|nr:glutamate racemase [Pseudomonadota bacterium]